MHCSKLRYFNQLKVNAKFYSDGTPSNYETSYLKPVLTTKYGVDLLHDPLFNKGTSWPIEERDRLGLRGLVPPVLTQMSDQIARVIVRIDRATEPIEKYNVLTSLQDRNEILFYKILIQNIKQLAPIIYTPTVGEVCKNFSAVYSRARGMYFSIADIGQMNSMVYNWGPDQVDVIVVTDGSRVLGLGDLGAQGMAISIGKLALYTAAGGIHPHRVIPITLDVGTNNEHLLNDPLYLGIRRKRIKGKQYDDFIDEFVHAIYQRWPNVMIQFEDFSNDNATKILERYRFDNCVFNDDIQGTGAVACAGIIAALKLKGEPIKNLEKQRFLVVGAGSAGLGVSNAIAHSMISELGTPPPQVYNQFYLVDNEGLVGRGKQNVVFSQRPFQRMDLENGMPLLDVVKHAKPTVILGLTGQGGLFTEEIIKEMYKYCERPIIFPMSNPTKNSECTAKDAYTWTEGKCIFASGSPFEPVELNGTMHHPSQSNNMYIFPGLGLAATAVQATRISYPMLHQATMALSNSLTIEEMQQGLVFPSINRIRDVSLQVATAVAREAYDRHCTNGRVPRPSNLPNFLQQKMWDPHYPNIICTHHTRS